MRIPDGPSGNPTVSASQLLTYGVAGLELLGMVEPKGCPRQYHALYVDRSATREPTDRMRLGTVVHQVMERVEDHPMGAEDALAEVWDPTLGTELYEEALEDLRAYMARESTPFDRYATLATETELDALLYVDEEFGPIHYRGRIDRLALDFDTPDVVHVGDWKNMARPPSLDDVRGSAQFKGYAYLVAQCWEQLGLARPPRVVVHLDPIKWRDLPGVTFDDEAMEAWHSWTVAVVRSILRDTDAAPVINWGCAYCSISSTCPAYQELPTLAAGLLEARPAMPSQVPWSPDEWDRRLAEYRDLTGRWRDQANVVRLLLDKAVKEIDARFKADAVSTGQPVRAGDVVYTEETKWVDVQDLRTLFEVMGDDFWDAVTTTKTALERITKDWPDERRLAAFDCLRREPSGTTVNRRKVKP